MKMRPHFRFEDLEIWQLAHALAVKLHLIADDLERPAIVSICGAVARSWIVNHKQPGGGLGQQPRQRV